MKTALIMYEKPYLINLHENDLFTGNMYRQVDKALLFEDNIDSIVFRVHSGIVTGKCVDVCIPVNVDRGFRKQGHDDGVETGNVLEKFLATYKQAVKLH